MSELLATYGAALLNSALFVIGFFVITLWLVSIAMRDSSIVDIFWGLGCAAVAWVAWFTAGSGTVRSEVALAAATIWGLRLGLYIGTRNWGAEDKRYARLRRHVTDQ